MEGRRDAEDRSSSGSCVMETTNQDAALRPPHASHVHPSGLQEVPVNYLLVNVGLLTRRLFPSGSVHPSASRLGCPDDVQRPRCPEVLPSAGVKPSLPPATSAAVPACVHMSRPIPESSFHGSCLSVCPPTSCFVFAHFFFLPAEFN